MTSSSLSPLQGITPLTFSIFPLDKYPYGVYIITRIIIPLQGINPNNPLTPERRVLPMSDCNCNKDQTTANISADAMPCDTTSDKSPVCSCCSMKHTDRSEADRRKLVNRLKRIEGQIRGIIGMLENDAYCNDILIQSAAVNAAVNSFNKELLANHIRTCVARDIRAGKDETIDELVATLQKLMK